MRPNINLIPYISINHEETNCLDFLPADDYHALSGCIGNDDSNEDDSQPEEIVELQDWHVHFAVNAADLPTCNEDTNGRLYYVEADDEFQVCKTAGWDVISIKGEDGAPGQDGNEGEKGEIGVQGIPGPNGKTTLISIL